MYGSVYEVRSFHQGSLCLRFERQMQKVICTDSGQQTHNYDLIVSDWVDAGEVGC